VKRFRTDHRDGASSPPKPNYRGSASSTGAAGRSLAAELQDLLGLWRGDEESSGYAQEGLALEIARRLKPLPGSPSEFARQLYADPEFDFMSLEPARRRMIVGALLKAKAEKARGK
jgi:hypothetical protein